MTCLSRLAAESLLFMHGFPESDAHVWLTCNETPSLGITCAGEQKNYLVTCASSRHRDEQFTPRAHWSMTMQHSRQCDSFPVAKVWHELKLSQKDFLSFLHKRYNAYLGTSVSYECVCIFKRLPTVHLSIVCADLACRAAYRML